MTYPVALDVFLQNLEGNTKEILKITLNTVDTIYEVNVSDIVFVKELVTIPHFIYWINKKLWYPNPLGNMKKLLPPQNLFASINLFW
jgi:hypothetical protein